MIDPPSSSSNIHYHLSFPLSTYNNNKKHRTNVLRLQSQQNKSPIKPLMDLMPFILLSTGTALLIIKQPQIFMEAPMISMGAISALFVEQVGR